MKLTKLILTGSALALGLTWTATPAQAQMACDINGVPQVPPPGSHTLACGSTIGLIAEPDTTAVGVQTAAGFAGGGSATAIGANAVAATVSLGGSVGPTPALTYIIPTINGTTAVGAYAYAIGLGSVAVGDQAGVGVLTSPIPNFIDLVAAGGGTAIGSHSLVTGTNGTAVGMSAQATALSATAMGQNAQATGAGSTAIGVDTTASTGFATAIGLDANAIGSHATALGPQTDANGADSTAVGYNADATADNSVAIGANSIASQANTVSVGAAGAERRIVNVAAGTGATDAVNVSQLGTVTGNVTNLQTQITSVQTVNTTQATQIGALQTNVGDLNTRVGAIEGVVLDFAEDLDRVDRRAAAGTATAIALSGAMFLPGKRFNLTGNVGAYHGAVAGALQIGMLVSENMALNAGIAQGFNRGGKTGVRAGFTFGW